MRFTECFWSSDYISGIKSLVQSLDDRVVETQAALEAFKEHAELLDTQGHKLTGINRSKKFAQRENSRRLEKFREKSTPLTLEDFNSQQFDYIKRTIEDVLHLSAEIKSDLILRLSDFIEDYNDFIKSSKNSLQFQYNQYMKVTQSVNSLEKKLVARMGAVENVQSIDQVTPTSSQPPQETQEDDTFQFPLKIGSSSLQTVQNLGDLLHSLMNEVRMRRRMIPIPGVNNEYFSSEDFVSWVKENLSNEDTRIKIEKFGQDMIELGLILNWNKLGSQAFLSDSGYYEFTDLARFTAKFDPDSEEHTNESAPEIVTSGMWTNWKSPFATSRNPEALKKEVQELNQAYIHEVMSANEERTKLEKLIYDVSSKAQVFESNRLELLFSLNKLFLDKLVKEHECRLDSLKQLQSQVFTETSLQFELLQTMITSNGGWYWPNNGVRYVNHDTTKKCLELLATDLVNQVMDSKDMNDRTRSVPVFVKIFLKSLSDVDAIKDLWCQPFDIGSANETKNIVFKNLISIDDGDLVSSSVHLVDWLFQNEQKQRIVNFFKLWLLELPDSVVPFTCYESLMKHYHGKEEQQKIVTILGSMPRQNLATLLLLMDHICSVISIDELLRMESFPFYHLILRPSPKTTHANIDDMLTLTCFIEDLYSADFREALYARLVKSEQYYKERENRHNQQLLASLKLERVKTPMITTAGTSGSHSRTASQELTPDGLRPFKTKSPSSSPLGSPKGGRSRTNSNLASHRLSIGSSLRPSDHLSKRNSLQVPSSRAEE
jgi:hypothetical protein